jgi:transposase
VPADHPLRLTHAVLEEVPEALSSEFERLYARVGRPSMPQETLLRTSRLQALSSVSSARPLMQQLDCNLLFRWFVGRLMDAPVWDASSVSKTYDRLLPGDVAQAFLAAPVAQPQLARLMPEEHSSVDGTLIQAWSSPTSVRPKDGSAPPTHPAKVAAPKPTGAARSAAMKHM